LTIHQSVNQVKEFATCEGGFQATMADAGVIGKAVLDSLGLVVLGAGAISGSGI